jgi:hypothetical protein
MRLSALHAGHPLSPRMIPGTHICQRLSTQGSDCSWKVLHKLKNPKALPGIDPATFQLVAYCLDHVLQLIHFLFCILQNSKCQSFIIFSSIYWNFFELIIVIVKFKDFKYLNFLIKTLNIPPTHVLTNRIATSTATANIGWNQVRSSVIGSSKYEILGLFEIGGGSVAAMLPILLFRKTCLSQLQPPRHLFFCYLLLPPCGHAKLTAVRASQRFASNIITHSLYYFCILFLKSQHRVWSCLLSTPHWNAMNNVNYNIVHCILVRCWIAVKDDVSFNPSTQRHYSRLIYYLYIHSYMFRSYDHHQVEKYITTLGLLNWQRIRCFIRSHITVIVFIILRIVDMPLLWATFSLRCVPSVYRYRRRRACQCSWGCSLSVDTSNWLSATISVWFFSVMLYACFLCLCLLIGYLLFGCGAAFIPLLWCVQINVLY